MMKKSTELFTAVSVAIISLLIIPLHNQPLQEPPIPEVRPMSASFESNRDNTSPTENKAVAADENSKTGTQNSPRDSAPTENNFEPPNKADSKEILTTTNAPRGTHPHLRPPKTRPQLRSVSQRWATLAQ